jgi:hypothetical protein
MTLSDFAALSTTVSGIAIPISLIYLAIQTQQNVRHTRALIQQGFSARTTQIALNNMDRDIASAWIEGNRAEATEEAVRKAQFGLLCSTAMAALDDLFVQRSERLLTDEYFERNCWIFRNLLAEPGLRAYWLANRDEIGEGAPKYRAFVDSLCIGEAIEFKSRF